MIKIFHSSLVLILGSSCRKRNQIHFVTFSRSRNPNSNHHMESLEYGTDHTPFYLLLFEHRFLLLFEHRFLKNKETFVMNQPTKWCQRKIQAILLDGRIEFTIALRPYIHRLVGWIQYGCFKVSFQMILVPSGVAAMQSPERCNPHINTLINCDLVQPSI